MLITVKEQRVEVKKPDSDSYWHAVVRDGEVTVMDASNYSPTREHVEGYIEFLKEVIEAIKNTLP